MTVNKTNRRFIAMPDFLNLNNQNIKYLDALTYATIRSFHNSTTGKCYPAYETIAEKAKMSRSFIISSVKRLENAGLLNITHSKVKHTCNQYHFGDQPRFERIPYELFEADITGNQKAMLLCLRQFFNEGHLNSTKTIVDFAKYLGVSYKTVYSQLVVLIDRGFINEKHVMSSGKNKNKVWYKLTSKINWEFDYTTVKSEYNVYPKLRVA